METIKAQEFLDYLRWRCGASLGINRKEFDSIEHAFGSDDVIVEDGYVRSPGNQGVVGQRVISLCGE